MKINWHNTMGVARGALGP